MVIESFISLVESAVKNNVSDIHFRSGEKPSFRVRGDLVCVKTAPFSREDIMLLMEHLYGAKTDANDIDGSFEVDGLCRIRYNFFRYQEQLGIVCRVISKSIPTIESLNLSPIIGQISNYSHGLVLVTGATGSGKSSTLAAMIDHINKTKYRHIITLEDPVEYLHTSIKSKITQRDIGVDTACFDTALKNSLRQDPDIIFIGEMRDSQTVMTALKAAETGHLVLGTIHTTNAISTIGRVISLFPPAQRNSIRARLSEVLRATVSQRLLKREDSTKRIAAQEIMLCTPGVQEAILKDKDHEVYTYIEKGGVNSGSQSFDQHLCYLYKSGAISLEEAISNASSPDDFERNLIFDSAS